MSWSETASRQLEAIRDHLTQSSPGYAQTLAERIIRRTEALDGQPRLGAEVPEYGDETIREIYEHPYRILYRVDGGAILVISVIHSSRRMPRTPPD